MDCRAAHTVMAGRPDEPDEQQAYQAHLAACEACRDDADDPFAKTLLSLSSAPAQPPADFTRRLLAQLPRESPLQLQRRELERARRGQLVFAAVGAAVLVAALGIGALLRPALAGSALGLFALAARQIVAQASVPLLMLLAAAAVTAFLLRGAASQPGVLRVFGGAAVGVALLLAGAGVVLLSDNGALEQGAQAGSTATVARGIVVDGSRGGDVVSAWGDIVVDGEVRGNVASLTGNVQIDKGTVQGDVFAGAGEVRGSEGAVAGTVFRGPQGLALTYVLGEGGTGTLSPSVRAATALLGALITLALAGLLVSLWPQLTLGASMLLPARPWLALGLGVLLSCLLALLTLPMLALLALTVFGVLLVPLLLLAVHLPYVQGVAVVGQALGQRLSGAVTMSSAVWGVAAQLVLVAGLALVSPLAGLAAFYLLGSLGLGAWMLWRSKRS